jgi:hypothetical protein
MTDDAARIAAVAESNSTRRAAAWVQSGPEKTLGLTWRRLLTPFLALPMAVPLVLLLYHSLAARMHVPGSALRVT